MAELPGDRFCDRLNLRLLEDAFLLEEILDAGTPGREEFQEGERLQQAAFFFRNELNPGSFGLGFLFGKEVVDVLGAMQDANYIDAVLMRQCRR